MKKRLNPMDLSKVRTYPLRERENKVNVSDFASPVAPGHSVKDFLKGLPNILAGEDFPDLVRGIAEAYAAGKPVIAMMGGHVIKCGLSPVIISLMKKEILTGVAMNGAASIHDFEIALIGETSEDVSFYIQDGRFGMWEETGGYINQAINTGVKDKMGMGAALGKKLVDMDAPHAEVSIVATAFKLNIPLTVHIALGTDITHQHPKADGAAIGETGFTDFRIFVSEVSELGDGGVILNFGSAVIMPEIFLKALSIARNLGYNVSNFITANFDMIQHYRPRENLLNRPIKDGGRSYAITGHHEIMIPLLAYGVMDYISQM
jgi:hypothetical protein